MCAAYSWSSIEALGLRQGEPRGRSRGGDKSWVLQGPVGLRKTAFYAKIGSRWETLIETR